MCTVGPSRPSTMPPTPMDSTPPANRAGMVLAGAARSSSSSAASTCWMPLSADIGQRVPIQVAAAAAATLTRIGISGAHTP